ncbi:MAG TPA: hypothetical protein VFW95_06985 [Candidatus Limnocylindria bacterium]|nr:hypothetical protein [Candidatus Limnocylindria bacterium]
MSVDIMVRSYAGANQGEAAARYAEDALKLADDGWVAVTQTWVADDWNPAAYLAALVLVIFVIGIVLLIVMALIKPTRTLLVTYQRPQPGTP